MQGQKSYYSILIIGGQNMKVKLKYNGKILDGQFTKSNGQTGIPPYREVFRTIEGSEYYPKQVDIIK